MAIQIPSNPAEYDPEVYHDKEALNNLGMLYATGKWSNQPVNPNYQKAKEYFERSNTSTSLYNLGGLYKDGCLGASFSKKEDKQIINYKKALKYFSASGLVEAKLNILELYQSEFIEVSSKEKQQIINKITEEINGLLPTLSDSKRCYVQGMLDYYLGDWESAFAQLQQAVLWGWEQDDLVGPIEEIINYFAEKESSDLEDEIEIKSVLTEENKEQDTATLSVDRDLQASVLEIKSALAEENKEQDNAALSVDTDLQASVVVKEKQDLKPPKVPRIVKLTKKQKQLLKSQQRKLKLLTMLGRSEETISTIPLALQLKFLSAKHQAQFEELAKVDKRINVLLDDIKCNTCNSIGSGKPKTLKHSYQGYTGCLSRRINQKDRLVYKILGKGSILILSWEGHYKKVSIRRPRN